jgi:hypothetical protein
LDILLFSALRPILGFGGAFRGMIEERTAVLLEVETQGATHVDVGVSDGRDACEMGLIELFGGFGDNGVDMSGVPEYNQIGDQG